VKNIGVGTRTGPQYVVAFLAWEKGCGSEPGSDPYPLAYTVKKNSKIEGFFLYKCRRIGDQSQSQYRSQIVQNQIK
jgi:hypothetical protein